MLTDSVQLGPVHKQQMDPSGGASHDVPIGKAESKAARDKGA